MIARRRRGVGARTGRGGLGRLALCLSLASGATWAAPAGQAAEAAAEGSPDSPQAALAALDALERRLIEASVEARAAQAQAAQVQEALDALEAQLAQLQRSVDERRALLSARFLWYRRWQGQQLTRALWRAESQAQGVRLRAGLRGLLQGDLAALREQQEAEAELVALQQGQRRLTAQLQAQAQRLEAGRLALEEARGARAQWLRAHARRRYVQVQLAQGRAEEAERLVHSLGPAADFERDVWAGFEAERGLLPLPVPGRLIEGFGEQIEPLTKARIRNFGWRIATEQGAPVRAVYEGAVAFAGWYRGFGQLVIVDHGADWLSLYGHLDEIAVELGEHIAAGQQIATAGETGALGGPQLYFELRAQRQPVDPALWLRPFADEGRSKGHRGVRR